MVDASPSSASSPPASSNASRESKRTDAEDRELRPLELAVPDRPYRTGWILILLLAALLRFWAIDFGLPHLRTRPDEVPVVDHTVFPARGEANVNWPVYPHTYIYLSWAWGAIGLELAQALGQVEERSYIDAVHHDKARVILIIRTLSAVMGTLAVALAMLLTRRIFGRAAALAVGFLVASNFLHARDSHAIKPDVFLSVGVLLTFVYIFPLARQATRRLGFKAGIAAGIAMAAKYPGVLLAPPVYLAAIMGASERGWRRVLPAPALVAAVTAALFFVSTNPFVAFSPRAIGIWHTALQANLPQLFASESGEVVPTVEVEEWEGQSERLAEVNKYRRGSSFDSQDRYPGFAYHTKLSLRYGMGLLPALLAPLALIWAALCRSKRLRAFTWPAALFSLVYFGVFAISPATVARYMTPLIPLLLVLEVGMLCQLIAKLAQNRGLDRQKALALLAVATVALSAESLAATIAHNRLAARSDTRVLATRWMAEHTPIGARIRDVGTIFMPYGRPHVPRGRRASKAAHDPESLARDGVSYVVTHDHLLFSSSLDPEVMARLEPHLTLLAEFDPYEGATAPRDAAIFELADPYYIPFRGFSSVGRPGPLVRIYSFSIDR